MTIFFLVKFNVEILVKSGQAVVVNGKLDWLGIPDGAAGESERAGIVAGSGGSVKIIVWNQSVNFRVVGGIRRGVIGARLGGVVDVLKGFHIVEKITADTPVNGGGSGICAGADDVNRDGRRFPEVGDIAGNLEMGFHEIENRIGGIGSVNDVGLEDGDDGGDCGETVRNNDLVLGRSLGVSVHVQNSHQSMIVSRIHSWWRNKNWRFVGVQLRIGQNHCENAVGLGDPEIARGRDLNLKGLAHLEIVESQRAADGDIIRASQRCDIAIGKRGDVSIQAIFCCVMHRHATGRSPHPGDGDEYPGHIVVVVGVHRCVEWIREDGTYPQPSGLVFRTLIQQHGIPIRVLEPGLVNIFGGKTKDAGRLIGPIQRERSRHGGHEIFP